MKEFFNSWLARIGVFLGILAVSMQTANSALGIMRDHLRIDTYAVLTGMGHGLGTLLREAFNGTQTMIGQIATFVLVPRILVQIIFVASGTFLAVIISLLSKKASAFAQNIDATKLKVRLQNLSNLEIVGFIFALAILSAVIVAAILSMLLGMLGTIQQVSHYYGWR